MEVESFMLRPINDIGNLEKLEQEFSNKEAFEKLKQQYSIVCSELLENGVNCAYRLLDILFTKIFLCSWTGGSRNAADVKLGLKAFKNVIIFFHHG
ncbi:unnamed protein product [Chilo suppressalis]|uniref:DUF4806 domain-containing protein n=1 Tax=Chilo suppressalis TaxID=168631 RepID=A0ABN8B733_CHISP|nr:unnamed protein product [Chilo suppressalis]